MERMTPRMTSTVGDLIARSAARDPGKPALHFGTRTWTYAELDEGATRVAGHLLNLGHAKGERIAAYGHNSDAYVLLYLGCARAGLIHVPISYNATGSELAYFVEQSGASALFADPGFADAVAALPANGALRRRGTLLDGDDLELDVLAWAHSGDVPELDVDVSDDDLVQLLYTSGTTSAPKGARMSHRAFVHEYASCVAALELSEHDRPIHSLPLYHSAQMHVFLLPSLTVGATNLLIAAPDPVALMDHVEHGGIDAVFCPPTVWIAIANHPELETRDLSGLRKAFYGASIMPAPVIERLRSALPDVGFYNCFGQSEIGPLATVLRPEEHDDRLDSAGRTALFVQARVVDEDMNDVPAGELGEIVYRSPQLCDGYWDKPEETAEAFAGGWFHSGDLVRRDEEGFVFVVDRVKDVINTGGVLVASREVEEAIYSHDAVDEVAVIALPHERWIEAITAVVVLKGDVDEEGLLFHCRDRLAGHKVPKAFHFVDELPKNPAGKVLKRELRDSLAA